jgi:hypothetical protein
MSWCIYLLEDMLECSCHKMILSSCTQSQTSAVTCYSWIASGCPCRGRRHGWSTQTSWYAREAHLEFLFCLELLDYIGGIPCPSRNKVIIWFSGLPGISRLGFCICSPNGQSVALILLIDDIWDLSFDIYAYSSRQVLLASSEQSASIVKAVISGRHSWCWCTPSALACCVHQSHTPSGSEINELPLSWDLRYPWQLHPD